MSDFCLYCKKPIYNGKYCSVDCAREDNFDEEEFLNAMEKRLDYAEGILTNNHGLMQVAAAEFAMNGRRLLAIARKGMKVVNESDSDDSQTDSKITHSAAPWRAVRGEIVANDDEVIGVIYRTEAWSSKNRVYTEDQANARLIVAAPDLLEACRLAILQISNEDVLRHIKKVIAQAEGELK